MYVKYFQSTCKVEVIYNSTHTNHTLGLEECKCLPLSESVQQEIQEKVSQGITIERIMDGCIHSYL